MSLIGSQFNARNGIGTSSFGTSSSTAFNRGPAVVTPWAEEDDRSLISRYNQIRNKTSFIDESTREVLEAGSDKDNKALFTLYAALNDLKTIAEYASDSKTSTSVISSLSSQFQTGLAQVDQYVRDAELDKLILLAGEKKSFVTSEVGIGKDDRDITGNVVAAISDTTAIVGLKGDEIFTINIDTISENDDITINLSEISSTLSLENLKNLINTKITELTTVNDDGETVSKYKSRASIEEVTDGKFALKFEVSGIEKLSFNSANADPALLVVGTNRDSDINATTLGSIKKFTNLDDATQKTSFSAEIAGIDLNGFVIPADSDDENVQEISSSTVTFNTIPTAIELDSQGNSYVVGTTEGDIGEQINGAKTGDVFLSKHSSTGNLLWSRLLGASDEAEVFDIAIDAEDNIVIAGKTNEELISSDVFSGTDAFVTKFSYSGEELWTSQIDTIATDQANGLTVDANGDVYVVGQVNGRIDATTTANGEEDVSIFKLGGASGIILGKAQLGSADVDIGKKIAIADDGNLLLVAEENGNAVVRKIDKDNLNNTLASYNLGNLNGGSVSDIIVDGTDIYISGSTLSGSLNGGPVTNNYNDGRDGFITKLNDNGVGLSADWTSYIGTSSSDTLNGISVSGDAVYLAGTTSGILSGESKSGITDGFTTKIDANTGATLWQKQLIGTAGGYNENVAVAFSETGSSVLDVLGLASGTADNSQTRDIATQTSLRAGDYFKVSVNGGRELKIEYRDGDTFDKLANRINTLSTRNLKASVSIGENGPALKLEARNGATIDFISGENGRDALTKLGLEERSIISSEVLFNLSEDRGIDPENLGGVFALGLNNGFSFSTKKEAEYILTQLQNSLNVIESANRSLTFDPIRAQILQDAKSNVGEAPAFLQDRIAKYQDGLRRVLAVTGGTII